MSRARVVHLTTVHHPFDPRILWKQAASLSAAGFDVCLVAQHTHEETLDGVRVVPLPPIRGRYRRIVLQRRAFATARALQADVYHFHDPELIPVAWYLRRSTGARIIYDMHEDYRGHGPVEGRFLRALERWCFAWVDHVVVANEAHAQIVKGAPVTCIANYFKPLDASASAHTPRSLEAVRLLYTGVMADPRGLAALLALAGEIVRRNLPWRIDLVGVCYRAADRHRAEARIEAEGLAQVVRRVGWDTYVPWSEIAPFYEHAHVGLALWEPERDHLTKIPTKFYEYLHHGLPILCSDFPRWRVFVDDHGCGAVVDPRDPEAALDRLAAWFDDPAQYRRLAAAALAAAPRYRWEAMEKRLVALYEGLLGGRKT